MTSTETQEDTQATPAADTSAANPETAIGEILAPEHAHDHTHEHRDPSQSALNPALTRSIEVEAPASDVNKAYSTIVRKYAKMARIPGFRAGKVPESLIRSRFARDLRQEVLDSLVAERFRSALAKGSMIPVSQPQVSELQLFEGQPLRFKATFEVLPEISIEGYDSIAVQRPDAAVTEDEYQAEMATLLDRHATVESIEEQRPLADGDWADISFVGHMHALTPAVAAEGEEPKPEQSATEQPEIKADDVLLEIGGKNTLPAFTDALRGAEVGKELTFEVEYPTDFGDQRLAGRTVGYDLKLNAIKRKSYPERDAEFAKQLGNYESWDDFEAKLRERVTERKKDQLETAARDSMLDALIGKFNFPVPETFVQQQIDARLERGLRALQQQGMTEDAMRQLDFSQLRHAQRDQAVAEVKASLILDKVADAERVEVTDDEFERELLMISLQTREPLETLRKRLSEDGSILRIREQMRREKTGVALFEKLAA